MSTKMLKVAQRNTPSLSECPGPVKWQTRLLPATASSAFAGCMKSCFIRKWNLSVISYSSGLLPIWSNGRKSVGKPEVGIE